MRLLRALSQNRLPTQGGGRTIAVQPPNAGTRRLNSRLNGGRFAARVRAATHNNSNSCRECSAHRTRGVVGVAGVGGGRSSEPVAGRSGDLVTKRPRSQGTGDIERRGHDLDPKSA